MKAFAFAVLASLAVSTEAGLSILSPTCTIKGKSDKSYSKNDCITHKSSFQIMYKGKMQFMMGKILNLGACDADNPYGKCYRVNDALFGVNPYGEKINGQLFYEFLKDSTGCTRVEPSFGFHDDGSNPTNKVLLLDRGSCSFVTKVRMAQNAGAVAAIVMDNNYQHPTRVFMADDGTASDITIPSLMVDYDTSMMLKTAIKSWGDNKIHVALDWAIPKTKGKAQWSLWTSAEDRVAKNFKKNFKLVVQRIGSKYQEFTPHMLISDGSRYCFRQVQDRMVNICGDTCLYDGHYCAISTDPHLNKDVKGKDIVAENLRQLCIFKTTAGADREKATSMWWDYIDMFSQKCNGIHPSFTAECSEAQMKAVGYAKNDVAAVRSCAGSKTSPSKYDYVEAGHTKNSILEAEIHKQIADGIFTIPTIIMNQQHYRGGLTCPHPPTLASCGFLGALCSVYADGKQPPACKKDYCWGQIDDCGTCLQAHDFANLHCCDKTPGKLLDSCGHCLNPGDPLYDQCNLIVAHGRSLRGVIS